MAGSFDSTNARSSSSRPIRPVKSMLMRRKNSSSDEGGACVGGHLLKGITVFVAEFTIREMTGVELVRTYREEFGLALW